MPSRDEEVRQVDEFACSHCRHSVPARLSRCPHCGTVVAAPSSGPAESPSWRGLLDHRWAMIGLLFGVLGPLAIPMLWKGRAFGVRGKTLLSLAVCVYTALLVGLVGLAVRMAWRAWSELI